MIVTSEYDGYKMPPPLAGPITPEIRAERERVQRQIKESAMKLHEKQQSSQMK